MEQQDTSKEEQEYFTCNTRKAIAVIGEKWILLILREFLYNGEKQTFNHLLKKLKPISSRTLSQKLKKLEASKLVTRTVITSRPIRVVYAITPQGQALKKILLCTGEWYKTNYKN